MPYKKVAHHCLAKVIVDPKWQRQGIGSSLVRNLKHLAKNYFRLEMMDIEVFEGNPLIELLQKEGFHEVFRQEKFVKEEGNIELVFSWRQNCDSRYKACRFRRYSLFKCFP
ncbi:MAG: GNAT family N-acetyltransferase [Rhabdochlamydiaceae bacterium]|jgi:ribosomal protein S18 acetylase RimI-like enzyme